MSRTVAGPLVVAVLVALGTADRTPAQGPGLPPAPVPVVPGAAGGDSAAPPALGPVLGPPTAVWPGPPPGPPPVPMTGPPPGPPPYDLPFQDRNGPLLRGDPLLDRPGSPAPGWFAGVDIALVAPHIKNSLVGTVDVPGLGPRDVHAPGTDLDWSGSSSVSVGYRFTQGFGEFVATYRSLVSEGSSTIPDWDLLGGADLKSRLNLNVLDLDYVSREYSLGPWWDLDWRAGVRLAAVYFDARADGLFMQQRTSNNFFGAGPHLGLEVARHLELPGLSVFAGVQGAFLLGHVTQNFEETFTLGDALLAGGAAHNQGTQAVPVLRLETGLAWTPSCDNRLSFRVGYLFEEWWYLGQIGASRAELTDQGVFFRSEFNF